MPRLLLLLPLLLVLACAADPHATAQTDEAAGAPPPMEDPEAVAARDARIAAVANPDTALFAAGCFWCAETAYEGRDGILAVVSGFAGGTVPNPTYAQVTRGGTGHYEVVQVIYDADVVSYDRLLEIFWRNIDPFQDDGQFCDRGPSYRSAIFALDAEQRRLAEGSKAEVEARFEPAVVTEILGAAPFYPAEAYHQDFWLKDPDRYTSYRAGCGRDARLEAIWGDEAGEDPAIGTY
ncbi:MAG: peptide-methionine (S)-S-oxide reductase MsrA [Rubricoccaceae bacterium]|nr:peptide-methionine (S)-S-oxide reductase MsrA [Rubricoccaceae bacterium]